MSMKIKSQKEALSLARNAVENAAARGPWMNITVCLETGELFVNRQTWEFPKTKMAEAVELIKKDLAQECTADALPDDPLPEVGLEMIRSIPMINPAEQLCDCPPPPVDLPESNAQKVPATPDDLLGEVEVDEIAASNMPLPPPPTTNNNEGR